MEGLSWFFWCLTPFGFFCTRNGTGLVTGFTFLILGFVCKYWNEITDTTPKIKIPQHEYWKYIYEMKINEGLEDSAARMWADLMCRSHSAWVPPYDRQEEIAKGILHPRGMKTEKELIMEARQRKEEQWKNIGRLDK